jgi:hypothetical protein
VIGLLSFAFAEEPEPPDSGQLLARAQAAVAALPGCFVMRGTAEDTWDAGIFGAGARTWQLGGTLEGGLWNHSFASWVSGKPIAEGEARASLFGRYERPDEQEKSEGRRSLLLALEDDVSMEYVERDGEGWRLLRTLRGGEAARNHVSVRFREDLRPWSWSVVIVDRVRVKGDRGQGWIESLKLDLTTDTQGAPASEHLRGRFTRWPFAVEVSADTAWTAEPCPQLRAP